MLNIAVLVSGGGTNLQALLDSEARGENPNGRITLVVASSPVSMRWNGPQRPGCGRRGGAAARTTPPAKDFDAALLKTLRAHKIDLVVLAGFLSFCAGPQCH